MPEPDEKPELPIPELDPELEPKLDPDLKLEWDEEKLRCCRRCRSSARRRLSTSARA